MKSVPDILLVMADQWAAASVGCYGCDVPEVTPNIDALAGRGIRFARHYATAPVCGPSRATIFTGRSPAIHGILNNNLELNGDTPLFTHHLKSCNYRTAGFGKFHFTAMEHPNPTSLRHLGFDQVVVTEDPKLGVWLDRIEKEHPEHYEQALAVSWEMPYLKEYGPKRRNLVAARRKAAAKWLAPRQRDPYRRIFYRSPLPVELHQTRWITDLAIQHLDRPAAKDGQPSFAFVSYVDPHDPYDPPAPYADLFDWRDMPPPVPREWTRGWCPEEYSRFNDECFELNTFTAETWARLRAHFYGSCRFVDDEIGRLLAHLKKTGRDRNTIVIFMTDHGDMIGDHSMLMKGPWHYDKCIRCPLVIAGPGVEAGAVFEGMTSIMDLFPTIAQFSGKAAEVPLEGRALPLNRSQIRQWGGWPQLALESNGSYISRRSQARSIVTEDGWRLTLYPGQAYGELFDLKNDPDEQKNLFRSPRMRARRLELSERLVGLLARQIFPYPLRNQAPGIVYDGPLGWVVK